MPPDLSFAKITRPRLNRVFQRTHLFNTLDQAREYPVIWVSAQPGSGKTTSINSYIEHRDLLCLWYQVDERDEDAATFFHYLSLAYDAAIPKKHKALPHLTPEYRMGLPTFTRSFFEQIHVGLAAPSILVFDNVQDVRPESELYTILSIALTEVPEGSNIIIISRKEPPPVLMRLLANKQMTTLKEEDLALSLEEVQGIANEHGYTNESESSIQKLLELTKGWVAGLVLALDKLKVCSIEDILESTPKAIFDYFVGEVFDNLNLHTQEVLLKSSFLPKITHQSLEKLTNNKNSKQILNELIIKNHFTTVHSGSEPVYEYHPLFRDFLQSRAQDIFTTDQLYEIQREAAILLRDNNQIEDSIKLLLNINDWQQAINIISDCAKNFIAQGRHNILESWIKRIPIQQTRQSPWIIYWLGICQIITTPHDSHDNFLQAYKLFNKNDDTIGKLLTASSAIESIFFENTDYSKMDSWITIIDQLTINNFEITDIKTKALLAKNMLLALVWCNPQDDRIDYWADTCTALWVYTEDPIMRAQLLLNLSMYHLYIGDFSKCANIIMFAKHLNQSTDSPDLTLIITNMILAFYNWSTANFDECENAIDSGLNLAKASGIRIFDSHMLSYGIYNALSNGNIIKADDFINKLAATISNKPGNLDHGRLQMLIAWHGLLVNDLIKAADTAKNSVDITSKSGAVWPEYTCRYGYAQVLFEQNFFQEANEQIRLARSIGNTLNSHRTDYECSVIEAYFALKQGDRTKCLEQLRHAFALGSKFGFMQMYFWRPKLMSTLSIVAMTYDIEIDYTCALIRKRHLMPDNPPHEIKNWPWYIRITTFGDFQIVLKDSILDADLKKQMKPLELLKALISFGSVNVSKDKLSEELWPDADGDAAQGAFVTTLHRLRKLIGNNTVELRQKKLSLDLNLCWIDVQVFETLFKTFNKSPSIELAQHLIEVYQGPFLGSEIHLHWAISTRERLQIKYLQFIDKAAQLYIDTEQYEYALDLYEKGLTFNILAENCYQGLMNIYKILGRIGEGLAVYKRCCQVFERELGAKPSLKTQTLAASLQATIKKPKKR